MFKTTALISAWLIVAAAPFAVLLTAPKQPKETHWTPPKYEPVITKDGGIGPGPVLPVNPLTASLPFSGSLPLGQGLRLCAVYQIDGAGWTFYLTIPEPPFDINPGDPTHKPPIPPFPEPGAPPVNVTSPLGRGWSVAVLVNATQAEINSFTAAYPDARVWGPLK